MMTMIIEDTVEVISKVARKHYKHTGRIIKECNTRWNKRMFLVEFGMNYKAKFYESSLKVVSLDVSYMQGAYI